MLAGVREVATVVVDLVEPMAVAGTEEVAWAAVGVHG